MRIRFSPPPARPVVRALPLLVALALAAGCGDAADDFRAGSPDGYAGDRGATAGPTGADGHAMAAAAQATSLLGQPLLPLPLDSADRARMEAQLDSAEAVARARPDQADALIWLGRRLAYLGRYHDAVEVFSEGIERHPGDARFYRHRGHRFITLRELDRAVEDLDHAARLISGQEDVVEPDGQPNAAGIPRSTLHTNIWYHLGLARYLQGDFDGAAHAFRRGYQISPNDDMRVAMADWLWLAYRRLGRSDAAAEVVAEVGPDMDIMENEAYLRRLRLYRGDIPPDSLMPADADPLAVATYGYGLGAWHLVNGDPLRARAIFRDVLATGYWPAFGVIAAEAELARSEGIPPGDTAPASRRMKRGGE